MRAREFEVMREEAAQGVTVLRPVGELDLVSVPRLEAAVSEALQGERNRLVLDLNELTFVDSSGLRTFLLLDGRSKAEGWELTLARPSPPVRTLFEITGAGPSLPLVEDWESP